MEKSTGEVSIGGRTEATMKVSGQTIKFRAKGRTNGPMDESTQENG
jgi:hypothetical protein